MAVEDASGLPARWSFLGPRRQMLQPHRTRLLESTPSRNPLGIEADRHASPRLRAVVERSGVRMRRNQTQPSPKCLRGSSRDARQAGNQAANAATAAKRRDGDREGRWIARLEAVQRSLQQTSMPTRWARRRQDAPSPTSHDTRTSTSRAMADGAPHRAPCGCRSPCGVARPHTPSHRRGRWRQAAAQARRRIPTAWRPRDPGRASRSLDPITPGM